MRTQRSYEAGRSSTCDNDHHVSGLPIIVLSICWFDREHDKYGEQLEMPIFSHLRGRGAVRRAVGLLLTSSAKRPHDENVALASVVSSSSSLSIRTT